MSGPRFPVDGLEWSPEWRAWFWALDPRALAPLVTGPTSASGRTSAPVASLDASTGRRDRFADDVAAILDHEAPSRPQDRGGELFGEH